MTTWCIFAFAFFTSLSGLGAAGEPDFDLRDISQLVSDVQKLQNDEQKRLEDMKRRHNLIQEQEQNLAEEEARQNDMARKQKLELLKRIFDLENQESDRSMQELARETAGSQPESQAPTERQDSSQLIVELSERTAGSELKQSSENRNTERSPNIRDEQTAVEPTLKSQEDRRDFSESEKSELRELLLNYEALRKVKERNEAEEVEEETSTEKTTTTATTTTTTTTTESIKDQRSWSESDLRDLLSNNEVLKEILRVLH